MMDDNNPKNQFTKKWLPLIIAVSLLIVLGILVKLKYERVSEERKNQIKTNLKKINVVTLELKKNKIQDKINLPGTIAPEVKLYVSAEVAGRIVAKPVKKGDYVKKGTIIAEIDESKYLNNFNAAKASYDSAIATFNRLEKLYKSQLSNKSDIESITAEVENRKAALAIAKLDLEKCKVEAPISGTVNNLTYEKGQFIDTGAVVAEIIRIKEVRLNVGIPESDVNAVKHIDTFKVTIDALNGKKFTAKKYFLSSTTDNIAKLYNLELSINNDNYEILPDMFARVDIVKASDDSALIIPIYSIISLKDKNIVYVEENGLAKSKEVTTGIQEGWMVQITSGLSINDKVIIVGHRSVSDNQEIKVIKQIDDVRDL